MSERSGSFFESFRHAVEGLVYALETERNLRLQIVAAIFAVALGIQCGFSGTELAVLFLTIGFVIALELVNTAIERAVDLAAKGERCFLAKAAKDTAAAGVLAASVASIGVGSALFLTGNRLPLALEALRSGGALTVVFAAVGVFFVMLPRRHTEFESRKGRH